MSPALYDVGRKLPAPSIAVGASHSVLGVGAACPGNGGPPPALPTQGRVDGYVAVSFVPAVLHTVVSLSTTGLVFVGAGSVPAACSAASFGSRTTIIP